MRYTCIFVLSIILLHIPYTYAALDLSEHDNVPSSDTRIIIHQKVNQIAETVDLVDSNIKGINHDIKKSTEKLKSVDHKVSDVEDKVDDIDDTLQDAEITLQSVQNRNFEIESGLDEVSTLIDSAAEQAQIGLSIIGALDSTLDVIESLSDSITDKACDIVSALEEIEDDTLLLEETTESIIDNTETILSFTEEIDSTTDIILSKVCSFESTIDLVNTILDINVTLILSALDDLNTDIDEVQTTADSILDKTCMILSLTEEIDSKLDPLETTLDSMFDKTCAILSIVDGVDSKGDVLLSVADIIESKVCRLTTCDNLIRQVDVGSGGVYTISLTGVYCLVENVDITAGAAITIDGGPINVTLELNNHTINGGGNADTTGVASTGPVSAIIHNGFITGTSAGVFIDGNGTNPVIIENVKVHDGVPVSVGGSPGTVGGIILNNAENVTVYNCHCVRVPITGFGAFNVTTQCVFRDCTAQDMLNAGFMIGAASVGCTLINCNADSNTPTVVDVGFFPAAFPAGSVTGGPAFGIFGNDCFVFQCTANNYNYVVPGGSTLGAFDIRGASNFFTSCASSNSLLGACGFSIIGTSHVLRDCASSTNSGDGFIYGPPVYGSADRTATLNCTAENNVGNGFILSSDDSSIFNLLRRNSALGNGLNGFLIEAEVITNKFLSNVADSNGAFGFNNTDTPNAFFNNSACYNTLGNYTGPIALVQRPINISGYWINTDCTGSSIGEFAQRLLNIQATLNDFIASLP